MSILPLVASALAGSLDAIVATWANISFSPPTPPLSANANQTLTFSGGSRTLQLTHYGAGSMEYRINSGAYTAIGSVGTFSVSSGDTLNFRYTFVVSPEVANVEIYDTTRGAIVDEFFLVLT